MFDTVNGALSVGVTVAALMGISAAASSWLSDPDHCDDDTAHQ